MRMHVLKETLSFIKLAEYLPTLHTPTGYGSTQMLGQYNLYLDINEKVRVAMGYWMIFRVRS